MKIRAGSLFYNPRSRIGAYRAGFGEGAVELGSRTRCSRSLENLSKTAKRRFSSTLHSPGHPCTGCTQEVAVSHLHEAGAPVQSQRIQFHQDSERLMAVKTQAEVCPLCEGTGWKTLPMELDAPKNRRVTRCDCQLRERNKSLLAAANIPRRYEHCELASYTTDFPGAHPSLAFAHLSACKFAQEYDPRDGMGLLIIGKIGTGKTHLAVGITKELVLNKGISCLFYDYRELLKEIQNSYNSTVQTTELDVLRPVFESDVLVLDELGAVKPTEWVWDTVSLILNTRYNDNRTTIITTNFEDQPAAGANGSLSAARAATRNETLGDRIGERMRSRLHEMCRVIKMEGEDFRQKFRSASFR